jgi:hypothetical protein
MPDVIIPVLDEAAALPALLLGMPLGYRPIVVDNGSRDGSADVAATFGAQVVHEPQRGFGSACWAGLVAAAPLDASCVSWTATARSILATCRWLPIRSCGPRRTWHSAPVARPKKGHAGAARAANRLVAWEVRRRSATQKCAPRRRR